MQKVSINPNQKKVGYQQELYIRNIRNEVEGDIQIDLRMFFSIFLGFVFGLIPIVMARWKISWRVWWFFKELNSQSLNEATHFLVFFSDKTQDIVKAKYLNPTPDTKIQKSNTLAFDAHQLRYIYLDEMNSFTPLTISLFETKSMKDIFEYYGILNQESEGATVQGLGTDEVQKRRETFGQSKIHIRIPSIFEYMAEEMTQPLYFLQYLACTIRYLANYILFSSLMIGSTTFLTIINYIFLRTSMKKLREKAQIKQKVTVIRQQKQDQQLFTVQRENSPFIMPNSSPQKINQKALTKLNSYSTFMQIDSEDLVPGDLLVIDDHMIIPCDCILVSGEIYVNEVTLTGESILFPKFELKTAESDQEKYYEDQKNNIRSVLFEGTTAVKTRPNKSRFDGACLAIVQRTGYTTFKGQIFRSLIYIKGERALFQKTSGIFIATLGLLAIVFSLSILFQFMSVTIPKSTMVLRMADMIIFVCPPAVPIMTTFCLTNSLARLRLVDIFGINAQSLLSAGKVTTCCFDKTGTLTELKLEFQSYILQKDKKFEQPTQLKGQKIKTLDTYNKLSNSKEDISRYALACCHNLIEDSHGVLQGDHLEMEMLKASQFKLLHDKDQSLIQKDGDCILKTIQIFPFTAEDQCQGVIAQHQTSKENIYFVKGSPEKMKQISKPETIPNDFTEILNKYTLQGLRVLGFGYKLIDAVDNPARKDMQKDVVFLGLLIFINKLKPDTAEVLQRLKENQFQLKMISGDNILTCAQTAKLAGIITHDQIISLELEDQYINVHQLSGTEITKVDSYHIQSQDQKELAKWIKESQYFNSTENEYIMNGKAIEYLIQHNEEENNDHDIIQKLIQKTNLFGRCRPEHKAMVIRNLKQMKIVCAMVGDGANDCSAIKYADVGISFVDNDASISAPFSSMNPSIRCIEYIILEGKCTTQNSVEALRFYTTTGVYKMVLCGILIFFQSWYNEFQQNFQNYVFGTFTLNLLFAFNLPYTKVTRLYPNDDLMSWRYIKTFWAHTIIGLLGFLILLFSIQDLEGYKKPKINYGKLSTQNMQNTILQLYCNLVSMTSLISMFWSVPFKRRIYYNPLLLSGIIAKFIWVLYMVFAPQNSLPDFKFVSFPLSMSFLIVGVWIGLFIVQFAVETYYQKEYVQYQQNRFKIDSSPQQNNK